MDGGVPGTAVAVAGEGQGCPREQGAAQRAGHGNEMTGRTESGKERK